jgi:hypothetical protein
MTPAESNKLIDDWLEEKRKFLMVCIEEGLPITAAKTAKDIVFNTLCQYPQFR